MEIDVIVKLSEEKTVKVCSALEERTAYDGMNDDIEFIFKCAFNKRKAVWDYCVENIWELSKISNEIRERIIKIMERGNAHEKFIITCTSGALIDVDKELFKKIIYLALKDNSKKVKIFGAQQVDSYSLYEFGSLIKEESEKTDDMGVKESLMEHYIFLTKGYLIEKSDSELGDWIIFSDGGTRLPRAIETEEEIHQYVITKFKNRPRIEDLYYRENREIT